MPDPFDSAQGLCHQVICVACGHPSYDHQDEGCTELQDMGMHCALCRCARTEAEVDEQIVPAMLEGAS